MKNSILFLFVLTTILFTTACEKEQISPEVEKEKLAKADFAHLNLPKTVTIQISDKPFGEIEANERKAASYEDVPCAYGNCDLLIEEFGRRLQKTADETCKSQWGEVICCLDNEPVYAVIFAEPNIADCLKYHKNTLNKLAEGKTDEYEKTASPLIVEVRIEACFRNKTFSLTAYDKLKQEPFSNRKVNVDWFENDNYIGSGGRLDCVSVDKITVFVQDIKTGAVGTVTIELPVEDKF